MKRKATSTSLDGDRAQPSAPMRKMTATVMMFLLRPKRSDSRPPITAPRVRAVVTRDSSKVDRASPPSARGSRRKGSAPEMTPVS